MRRKRYIAAALLCAASMLAPMTAGAASDYMIRVSANGAVEANGATPPLGVPDTTTPSLSLDGLTLAFASDASNLVPGDTNNAPDIFVKNLRTRKLQRVSTSRTGAQANGASYSPALSVDGRYLAFVSTAPNLVSGDTNGFADVFLKDLRTGVVERVSVTSSGQQANGDSNTPFVSLFGRWVTFESSATNLSSNDTNSMPDAFMRDRSTRRTIRMPTPAAARPQQIVPPETTITEPQTPLTLWTSQATVSYDGTRVAFLRIASRVSAPAVLGVDLPSPPPARSDVFVWDRRRNKVTQIAAPSWGGDTCAENTEPTISADGRRVVFVSQVMLCKYGFILPNPLDHKDVLVYDVDYRHLGAASVNNWFQMGDGDSHSPSVSADAERIAFVSDAQNLVAGDTNGQPDVFVRDNQRRTTTRISIAMDGSQPAGASTRPSISYEGRNVVYASTASNLTPNDRNNVSDVFWRDRRLHVLNRRPTIARLRGTRTINMFQETTLQLRASDPDRDRIRFGSVLPLPAGASLNSFTGEFRWTPTPQTKGKQVFAFWAEDPAGEKDYTIATYHVRSATQSLACIAGACSTPVPDVPDVPTDPDRLLCFSGLCSGLPSLPRPPI